MEGHGEGRGHRALTQRHEGQRTHGGTDRRRGWTRNPGDCFPRIGLVQAMIAPTGPRKGTRLGKDLQRGREGASRGEPLSHGSWTGVVDGSQGIVGRSPGSEHLPPSRRSGQRGPARSRPEMWKRVQRALQGVEPFLPSQRFPSTVDRDPRSTGSRRHTERIPNLPEDGSRLLRAPRRGRHLLGAEAWPTGSPPSMGATLVTIGPPVSSPREAGQGSPGPLGEALRSLVRTTALLGPRPCDHRSVLWGSHTPLLAAPSPPPSL